MICFDLSGVLMLWRRTLQGPEYSRRRCGTILRASTRSDWHKASVCAHDVCFQAGGYEQNGCSLPKMTQLIQSTTGKDGHGQTEMTDAGLDFSGFKDYLVTLQQIASAGPSASQQFSAQNQDGTVHQWSYQTEETESLVQRLQNEAAAADAQAEQNAELANLVCNVA